MECNFCIICLADLEKLKRAEKCGDSIKFLIPHLLRTHAKVGANDGVANDILKLSGVGVIGDDEVRPRSGEVLNVCEKCELAAERILELHQKLSTLQREISKEVKSVKETILRGSGWLGGVNGAGGEETFGNFAKKFYHGDGSSTAGGIFKILRSFQEAVCQTDKSVQQPAIHLLDESTTSDLNLKDNTVDVHFLKSEISSPAADDGDAESLEGSLHLGHFLDDYVSHFNKPLDFEVEGQPLPEDQPSKEAVTPSSSSALLTSGSLDLKTEAGIELPLQSRRTEVKPRFKRLYTHKKDDIRITKKRRFKEMYLEVERKKKRKTLLKRSECRPSSKPSTSNTTNHHKTTKRPRHIFQCESCDFKCGRLGWFEQHLRQHEDENGEKDFQCRKCKMGFSTLQYYNFHRERHQGELYKLKCDICQKHIGGFELATHMKTHVNKLFPCSYCAHYSSTMDKLMFHIRFSHFGVVLKCEICGKSLQSKKGLEEHLHESHKAIEKFQCNIEGCEKTFMTRRTLNIHKKVHTNQFVCKMCGKRHSTLSSLESHQRLHTGEKFFKCSQCEKAFNSYRLLQSHLVRDHGQGTFDCSICGKKYGSYEGLHIHKKVKHDGNVKCCTICNKKCATASSLRVHMEQHSSDRKYMCEVCGKAFKTNNKCNQHKRIHGDKKFSCLHCPKAFTKPGYLEMHVRTHTGEKPYPCDLCGKAFSQKGSVNIHRRKCQLSSSSHTVKESIQP